MGEVTTDHIMAELQKMSAELPEGEKNENVKEIIKYLIRKLVESGFTFYQALKNVDEQRKLVEFISIIQTKLREPDCGKEEILKVIDVRKKNASDSSFNRHLFTTFSQCWDESSEPVKQDDYKITPSAEDTKKLIQDKLTSYQQERSNEMITSMAAVSAMVAAFQVVKIYMTWKTISEASNVVKENPEDFTAINKNIEEMEKRVMAFLELCETNPEDRGRISLKMEKINTLFTSTLDMMSELQVKINGHIQRLDLTADCSLIDGGGNAITAVSNGIQLWHAWEYLTSYTPTVLGVVMTAVFTGIAVANFTQFYLSRETLSDLRRDFREVDRLRRRLRDLHKQAKSVLMAIPE